MSLTPKEITDRAIAEHKPVAIFVGFSGGRDSLATAHWMMENVPRSQILHINTGIGIEETREFVRDTCADRHWPLTEIRAKEDCGKDYDEIVVKHGFPGPPAHRMMYSLLKERPIRELVRRSKTKFKDRVMIATGIRHEESVRRMRYAGQEVTRIGAQLWVSPIYWWSGTDRDAYIAAHNLPVNPVSQMLGMSGECLCGAFAHCGEKALISLVSPKTHARIEALEAKVSAAGFGWGWEGRAPTKPKKATKQAFRPMCVGCEK